MLSEPFFLSLQLAGECDSYRGLGSGGSAVLVRRDHANHGRGKPTTTQAKSRIPFFARAKVCTLRFFFLFFSCFFLFIFCPWPPASTSKYSGVWRLSTVPEGYEILHLDSQLL